MAAHAPHFRLRLSVRFLAGLTGLTLFAAAAAAQATLQKDSPFLPKAGPAAVAAVNETLEFAGVSSIGKKTDLIIFDKAAKKSRWIPLGETVEGITAVNYDSRLEQAVLQVNGGQKVLTLRKGSGPLNAPAPVAPMPAGFNIPPALPPAQPVAQAVPPPPVVAPAPTAATPAKTPPAPETQARQEVEARMLVSDLLEIGMAQRKAYEEAQRKAAERAPPTPGQPSPPNGG